MAETVDSENYRRARRRFATITYILTVVLLLVALGEWCIFYFIKAVKDYFTHMPWVGSILFAIGLILLVLFIFFEGLRFNPQISWLFAVLIYECIVVGMAPLVVRQKLLPFLISFVIWTLALLVFVAFGTLIPVDVTVNLVLLFVIAVMAIIGAIYFLMLYVVINIQYSFIVFSSLIVFSICLFVMYHAQIINGGRFAEMRTKDYFLAALILFLDFLFMYMFSFQLAPKFSDRCDQWNNETYTNCTDNNTDSTPSYIYNLS